MSFSLTRLRATTALTTAVLLWSVTCAHATSGTVVYDADYVSQFGTTGSADGQFQGAEHLSIAPDGSLYVTDRYNQRVQVFDRDGVFVTKFGVGGVANGQFTQSFAVHVNDDGHSYISDPNLNRIQIFDDSNAYLSQFGTSGGGNGQFDEASDIAHDAQGNIYVADTGHHRVQVFDAGGNYITQFGGFGSGNGQMNGPRGIAIGPNGNIYVTEVYNQRIQIFDSSFAYVGQIGMQDPDGIHVDAFGNIYVTQSSVQRFLIYDPNGNIIATVGSSGSGNGQFATLRDLAADATGRIYTTEFGTNRVQIFQFSSVETFAGAPGSGDETALSPSSTAALTGSGTFADDFIGYSALDIGGTSWTLSGASSFIDAIDLNSGILINNGTLTAPDITIDSGTTVRGSGTFVGDVAMNGTIAPGNSIGTLTVTGDYAHDANATYEVEVNDAGQSDRIAVSGTATLNGGLVDVIAANGNYALDTDYTILTAGTALTGTFGSVQSNFAFLVPTLTYQSNAVILRLHNNNAVPTFSDYAYSDNQSAVATALDAFVAADLGGDTAAKNTMATLSQSEASQLLSQIAPDEIAALPQMQTAMTRQMQTPMWQRLSGYTQQSNSDSADSFALITPAAGEGGMSRPRHAWLQAIAGVVNQDTTSDGTGYRLGTSGMRTGMDKELSPGTLIGISAGYSHGNADYKSSPDHSSSDYGHIDAYGHYETGGFILEGFAGAGGGRLESTRIIDAGGFDLRAEGDTIAYDISATAKVSRPVGLAHGFNLIPSLAGSTGWYKQNGFTESGAAPFNLDIDDTTRTPVTVTPMVNLQKSWMDKEGRYRFTPDLGVGATWQVNERDQQVNASFVTGGNTIPGFTTSGAEQKPVLLNVQLGFTLEPFAASGFVPDVKFAAGTQMNETTTSATAKFTLNWEW